MITFQLKTLIVPLQFNKVIAKQEFLSAAPLTRFIAQSDCLIQIDGRGVFGGAAVGLVVVLEDVDGLLVVLLVLDEVLELWLLVVAGALGAEDWLLVVAGVLGVEDWLLVVAGALEAED